MKLPKWILSPLKGMIKNSILEELKNNQDKIIKTLSDKIVIPNLNEAREKELLIVLYNTIEEIVGTTIAGL
jgi:uncharacterized coiled-coil protein SlyX